MAQFDCRDESDHCLSRSVVTNLHIDNSDPVNYLISQTMNTTEQLPSGFPPLESSSAEQAGSPDESNDCLNQPEDCSPPIDISSALRSVASMGTWDFGKMHSTVSKLFSEEVLEEDDSTLSPLDDQDTSTEEEDDPAKEKALSISFHSKYIHIFPLYQDYCLQAVKDDLHSFSKCSVSELITPQYLQGLQSRLSLLCRSEAPSPQQSLQETTPSSHHLIKVTPCTLWQDLDEVKAAGLLSSLTTREIRLQESMFELIGSEASYLRSLGVAVDHFFVSKPLKQTLSQMEHHILFSNIRRVKAASEKFLMDLEIRLGESVVISQVGDIVLQHCPAFRTLYVPYVTNMMYQEALINQLLQQNRDFLFSLKKLESDSVCQRQRLKSFLVLPFQRITRIKLILESILKLTKPDSDSVSNLEKAIEAIHEIVSECDKGVKKMKQIEELVCLEMLLDFGKMKSVPLVVSGRFLVHQGPMKQLTVENTYNSRMSFIGVYLHLFNDLLIISSKKDQRFIVEDHAEFPTHVHVEHLKTEVLGLPPDSFLLHLSQSQTGQPTAMILVTHTRSDKETWMKVLSSKQ
ncbi:rho guanine nucleotide exchange factor 19 [Thunnus maccoyii]|uniref:rho guanine nucleotide exchange factor 19 n=1 Tax=Thunnus maccoyii TaxID=8240 RepID=UPI001C4C7845|nr:rho guanine nucleotide exchange factor 19 [Thunnus maccoyii]XP_042261566.1 rho guanine nucleotide exchange factor 19 [Thunnus maccoyii]